MPYHSKYTITSGSKTYLTVEATDRYDAAEKVRTWLLAGQYEPGIEIMYRIKQENKILARNTLHVTKEDMDVPHRFRQFKWDFLNFFDRSHIRGTADQFYGTPETYRGIWISTESENHVPGQDVLAFNPEQFNLGADMVHPVARKWLDEHRAWASMHDGKTVLLYLNERSGIE